MNSIVESVAKYASVYPEKTAVIANDCAISYEQLWKEVRGFANYIKSCGFSEGTKIVVKSDSDIWFAVACFAIHLSGGVHIPLEKTIGVSGLEDVAQQLGASMVIADIEAKGNFVLVDSKKVRDIGAEKYDESTEYTFPASDMVCDMMFTTGTTGKSKGVVVSHKAVVAVAENVQYGAEIIEDNVYLVPAPINHASAIRKLYVSMLTGTTVVLLDGFRDIKKFYACIEKYGVTSILMPPSAVRMILMLSKKELAKYSDQLHHIHTGSAAFPEADKELLCEILPNTRLYFAYGSSEAGCVSMFDYSKNRGLISCVGKPNKNAHIFIVDDDRKEIKSSASNQGLIAISGDVVMNEYYNEPELTKEVLCDGVVYTNDMGYIDENGYIYMLGRRGDVISIGGLKIAPTEVENVVLRYPGIMECACFAVEDRMGGAVPKLNIVEEKGVQVDVTELKKYMAEYLEAFKIPKKVEKVEEIPKTANGKINRKELR
ncbi:MAG: acyl--CoA ligase [Lachnospiraceae bacterium]|nr:acyl--CoA ligase [Lachnospiraceae bacterium]